MANSRLEKVGTIYTRIRGLLKAGAMRPDDKPVWYDVYEAFPPKNMVPSKNTEPLRPIFYPEDEVRARFHKEKIAFENVNLQDTERQTKCQQFVSKYQEFAAENENLASDELFSMAVESSKISSTPAVAEKVEAGDSSLAASFKNAFSEKNQKLDIKIADVFKEDK